MSREDNAWVESRTKTKIHSMLSRSVGERAEVELDSGEIIYGIFDAFEMSNPAILGIKLEKGYVFINFQHVVRMRVAEERQGSRGLQNFDTKGHSPQT